MAYSRLLTPRTISLLSVFSLGSAYLLVKSRALAEKQRERPAGDYRVTVDRSGGGI